LSFTFLELKFSGAWLTKAYDSTKISASALAFVAGVSLLLLRTTSVRMILNQGRD